MAQRRQLQCGHVLACRLPHHPAGGEGGGTWYAHQGAAHDALPEERQEFWSRLSSVNSTTGVVHPAVHVHPVSGRRCLWLHLGMTGAVIEKQPDGDGVRLLDADELKRLCHEYNDILNAGLENGYAIAHEYRENDCVFIDNLAVAHRAAPTAHLPAEEQGLRIMHRSTVRGVRDLAPATACRSTSTSTGPARSSRVSGRRAASAFAGTTGFRCRTELPGMPMPRRPGSQPTSNQKAPPSRLT
ncbi:MAG: TauD/TfdA family dioxygenase [Gammaproteobacteria bacterium]|nr:TauD/TfdA family dioxygenase [Gammaproteobacteria bacterium]